MSTAGLRASTKSFLHIISPHNAPFPFFFFRGIASSVFVKGISFSSTEESLAKAFSRFGKIVETKIIRNKATNRSKGYGFVTFATEDDAQQALAEMNGKVIDGRPVFVDKVSENETIEVKPRMRRHR